MRTVSIERETSLKNCETSSRIDCLLVDIGGVLLSDGWGHEFRKRAAVEFGIDFEQMDVRHQQAVAAYEIDNLALTEYLKYVVFYEKRAFTSERFIEFMFGLSMELPDMTGLMRRLKEKYGLKIVVVSNEARDTNVHRILKFSLAEFVDVFVCSSFVRLRKPDPNIFRLALDLAQIPANRVRYIDNTTMFVEIAKTFGTYGLVHHDYTTTCEVLRTLGLDTNL